MTWQPAGILYPDLELLATAYLRSALAGRAETYAQDVYVSNTVPSTRRTRMVIVRRDGGAEGELVDAGRLAIRVWAGSEKDATDLARLVNALWSLAPDGSSVTYVRRQSGPLPVPDESGAHLRYSLFDVTTVGAALT